MNKKECFSKSHVSRFSGILPSKFQQHSHEMKPYLIGYRSRLYPIAKSRLSLKNCHVHSNAKMTMFVSYIGD